MNNRSAILLTLGAFSVGLVAGFFASRSIDTPGTHKATAPDPGASEESLGDISRKLDALREELARDVMPIVDQRFEDGLTEHVTDEDNWHAGRSEVEMTQLIYLRHTPGKGWDRTVLPRDQYPEFYKVNDEIRRLEQLAGLMRVDAGCVSR